MRVADDLHDLHDLDDLDDLDDRDDRDAFGEGAGSLSWEVSAGYAVWGWGRLCGAEERRAMGAQSEACLSPQGELPSGPPATEHRKEVAKRPPAAKPAAPHRMPSALQANANANANKGDPPGLSRRT